MSRPALNLVRTLVFATLSLALLGTAIAQSFPSRAIRVIVPYSAGTGSDLIARIIAPPLSERIKQPVLIENRVGAGGIVGTQALKQSAPDGYTIGVIVSGNAIQPFLVKDLPFDIRKDFVPLTLMYSGPVVMTVPLSVPARTLGEFIAWAKGNPGKVFFGSVGTGTTSHMAGELLKQLAGIDMTVVPFKGTPEVYAAMFTGDIHMLFDNYATPRPHVEAGKLRALAVASAKRWAPLPNVAPIAETFPGFEVRFWTGFAAPLGTPKDIADRIATDITAVMNSPEVHKRIADTSVDPGGGTPAEFAQLIASDTEKWSRVVQRAGMKMQ
jgi:tripartite-type tricarboxylate transporter receptor subunit TctC